MNLTEALQTLREAASSHADDLVSMQIDGNTYEGQREEIDAIDRAIDVVDKFIKLNISG